MIRNLIILINLCQYEIFIFLRSLKFQYKISILNFYLSWARSQIKISWYDFNEHYEVVVESLRKYLMWKQMKSHKAIKS